MSFDSHSLERLRELGRKLPKSLPEPNNKLKSRKKTTHNKLHPIETEQNPQKLFRELITASTDGEIPSHLIERLKETELLELKNLAAKKNNTSSKHVKEYNYNYKNDFKSNEPQNDLYITFKQLLLEDDNDD